MKMMLWIAVACLLLSGCQTATFETLGDVSHVIATRAPNRQVLLEFPEDATVLTAAGTDSMYVCGDYTLYLQVMPAGDTRATLRSLCGYDPEKLTVLESTSGAFRRLDWVWSAVGENADVVCRGAVIDDGNYHYSLCVSADAELVGDLTQQWNALFASFCLAES